MASKKISDKTERGVDRDLKNGCGVLDTAIKYGVSHGFVSGRKRRLGLAGGPPAVTPKLTLRKREEKREADRVKEAYAEAITKIEELEGKVKYLQSGVDLRRHYQPIKYAPKTKRKGEAVASLYLGDWHYEEEVSLSAMNGLNAYNKDIREERLATLWPSVAGVMEMYQSKNSVDTLIVHLGGDFLTGWIHEELQATNSSGPCMAVFECFNDLLNGLRFLAKELKGVRRILVPCAAGNHGRGTKKKWFKYRGQIEASFDWMIYRFLARWFESYPEKGVDVQFQLPQGIMTYYAVYDMTVRLTHGDDIQCHGGAGGIGIPARKAIDAWNASKRADYTTMGHFHREYVEDDYRISGALIGFNEYALAKKLRFAKPSQPIELYHPKYGVTGRFPIILPKGF